MDRRRDRRRASPRCSRWCSWRATRGAGRTSSRAASGSASRSRARWSKMPKLLLLDEPLAALDRKLREETRFELVGIQERVGITFLVVTHDQEEAMSMATRIAVMDRAAGSCRLGTPAEIYERPASRFVADFVGAVNLFDGARRRLGRAAACVVGCPEPAPRCTLAHEPLAAGADGRRRACGRRRSLLERAASRRGCATASPAASPPSPIAARRRAMRSSSRRGRAGCARRMRQARARRAAASARRANGRPQLRAVVPDAMIRPGMDAVRRCAVIGAAVCSGSRCSSCCRS